MEYIGFAILLVIITGVLSIKYNWGTKVQRMIYPAPEWEEVFYIYEKHQHPMTNYNNKEKTKYLSREVFIIDQNNQLHVGCYNFKSKKWELFTTNVDHDQSLEIKWMYKPNAFHFTQPELSQIMKMKKGWYQK